MLSTVSSAPAVRFGELSSRAAELWERSRSPEVPADKLKSQLDGFEKTLTAEQAAAEDHKKALADMSEQVAASLEKAKYYRDLAFMTGLFAGFADTKKKAAELPESSRRVWEDGIKKLEAQTKTEALELVKWGSPLDALRSLKKLEAQQRAGVPVPHKVMVTLRERVLRVSQYELNQHITQSARITMGFEKGWYAHRPGGALQRVPSLVKLMQEASEQRAEVMKFPLRQKEAWDAALKALETDLHREWQQVVRSLSPAEATQALTQIAESPVPVRDDWALPLLKRAQDVSPKS